MEQVIKIKYQDELRRLRISKDDTVAHLRSKIEELMNLKSHNIQMKWTDSEGDEIIIATDEDLREALEFHNQTNTPLRINLKVTPLNNVPVNISTAPPTSTSTSATLSTPLPSTSSSATETNSTPNDTTMQDIDSEASSSTSSTSSSQEEENSCHGKWRERRAHYWRQYQQQQQQQQQQLPEVDERGRVLHRHVVCDGCQGHIYGIRYKCSDCEDFDLCEACEAQNLHPEEHILMKIKLPSRVQVFKPYVIQKFPAFGVGCPRRRWRGCGNVSESASPKHENETTSTPTTNTSSPVEQPTQQPTQQSPQVTNPTQPVQQQQTQPVQQQTQPSGANLEREEFQYLMQQLKDMGFNDEQINRRLLRETRGDIDLIIQRLTQM